MAAVYLAYDPRLNLDVALKVMPAYLAAEPSFVERFRREGQTLATLTHPHILRLYDLGEDADHGLYFLVLEYLGGGTLSSRLNGVPVSPPEVVAALRPVAAALDFAHTRGVVHRDLKPSNILFSNDGRAVVADFGIARLLEAAVGAEPDTALPSLTADRILGTPQYMAPEQAEGAPSTAAVDRYALAVIAYQMLVGRVPFSAATPQAVLVMLATRPLPLPSFVNPQISGALERVLLTGLARDPNLRFSSATEFVDALEKSVPSASEQVLARQGRYAPRLRRSQAVGLGLLAVLVVLVLVGLATRPIDLFRPPTPPLLSDSLASDNGTLVGGRYTDGEYSIAKPDAAADSWATVRLPVTSADLALSIDARLVSDDPQGQINLTCRARDWNTPDYAAYQLIVLPKSRAFALILYRAGSTTYLGGMLGLSFTDALPEHLEPGATDHLELDCIGDAIVARINNTVVASIRDQQLRDGGADLEVGAPAGAAAEGRFRNLLARAADASTIPVPQQSAAADFQTSFARSGGELHIVKRDVSRAEYRGFFTAGNLADASLSVEAQLVSSVDAAGVNLTCRISNENSWYQLTLYPAARTFELKRRDRGTDTFLVPRSPITTLPDRDSAVDVKLRCVRDTLSVWVDGQLISAVTDTTYTTGKMSIQGNGPAGVPLDLRLNQLAVSSEAPESADAAFGVGSAQPGTLLLADTLTDGKRGWFPRASTDPHAVLEYGDGGYRMARTQDAPAGYAFASLPGEYRDTQLDIDAEISRGVLELKCRAGRNNSWYVWRIIPDERAYTLNRAAGNPPQTVSLAQGKYVRAVPGPNEASHLSFGCVGDLISIASNGTQLAAIHDAALQSGNIAIQAGGIAGATSATLRNLQLKQG